MIRHLTFASCLALSACAVPIVVPLPVPDPEPIDTPRSAKERFVSSVAANGCSLNSANSDIVMADAVLSREDLARVMTELSAEGRGQIEGQAFRLSSGACA